MALGDPDDLEVTCERLKNVSLGYAWEEFKDISTDAYMAGGPNKVDAVARVTVEHIRDHRDATIHDLHGTDNYLISVWAHAQMANVVILAQSTDLELGALERLRYGDLRPKAEVRLAALHRAYTQKGNQMTWYKPPSTIRTRNQFRYARKRAIENSRR